MMGKARGKEEEEDVLQARKGATMGDVVCG